MAVFNPSRMPSNIQSTRKVQEKTNDFGDGYCQNILDGINAVQYELSCVWNGLAISEFEAINTFLKDNAGKNFTWNPFRETNARKWHVGEWNHDYAEGRVNLTVKMKEVFA